MVIIKNENKTLCLDSKNIVASNSQPKICENLFFFRKLEPPALF